MADNAEINALKAEIDSLKAEREKLVAQTLTDALHLRIAGIDNSIGGLRNQIAALENQGASEELKKLQARVDELEKEFNLSEYDIWTETGPRDRKEQEKFKKELLKYYNRSNIWGNKVQCMVTNEWHKRSKVIGGHLWMSKTRGKGLLKFGLGFSDLLSPRNGLLMLEPIEDAFDIKYLCFLYNPLGGENSQNFVVKVLNPNIKDQVITGTTKRFRDIDGAILQHPKDCFPFRRILSFHAKCAYKLAKSRSWITNEVFESFGDYFDLSETASNPNS